MNVRQAFETHLSTMVSVLSTEYENVAFTPTNGTAYQSCYLLLSDPDDYTLSLAGQFLESGIFQVTIKYPTGTGATTAEDKARAVRDHFRRGTILTNNDDGIEEYFVNSTPSIRTLGVDGDRFNVVVSVPFRVKLQQGT